METLNRDIIKKVLDIDEIDEMTVDGDSLIVDGQTYNLYKFAHKDCKEWAAERNHILYCATVDNKSVCIVNLHEGGYEYINYKDTEHEAIFDSMNWIIDRLDL
jgi:hypothetical protein